MKKIFMLIAALLILNGISFAQNGAYTYDPLGGIRHVQTADVRIYPGQLVSRLTNGHVAPVTAGATSGVVGVATTSANAGGTVLIGVLGTFSVSIDNTCNAGNTVTISATVNGNGTCSSGFPSGQVVGMFFDNTASGAVTIHITPETSMPSGATGGGSMTWPASAGIAVYTGGSAWGTSLTAPVGAIVGTSDTQTLTNKTIDGVSPTTMGFLDATSSIQTQLNVRLTASSSLTTGVIPQITGASTLGNSSPALDNGNTTANTLTYAGSGGMAATGFTSTGANAGEWTCGAGTGNGVGGASSIRIECPASVTAYDIVLPSLAGTANQVMQVASVAGNILTMQWAGSGAGPNFTVPVTIAPLSGTTTSFINYPENTAGLGQQPLTGIISVTGNTITAVTSKAIQTGQSGVFGLAYASSTDTITSTGPNDSLGNAVTCGTPVAASANISLAKCWFNNSGAAGVDTITITLSGTVSNAWIAGEIYSGFITTTPTDGADVSATGNSNAPSSGAYTSTNANDLIFTMIADVNYLNTYALGGGFNERNFNFINGSTQNGGIIFADQLATSTGSFTGSLTLPVQLGGRWIAITGGIKLSAAPAIADIGGNQTPDNYPYLSTDIYGVTQARKFATPGAYSLAGPGGLPAFMNVLPGQSIACAITSATASNCLDFSNGTLNVSANISNQTVGGSLKTSAFNAVSIATQANCTSSASPAVCAGAAAGSFVIAAAATSVVVDTSAVTANSQVFIQEDDSLGTKLGVTCNTAAIATTGVPEVTARTAGTSFTVTITTGPTTNPACYSYFIVN